MGGWGGGFGVRGGFEGDGGGEAAVVAEFVCADEVDVHEVKELFDLHRGIDGGGDGEKDSIDVHLMEFDDGPLAEAVVGSEEFDMGLEDVEVAGVEGKEDVALEGGGRVGMEGSEVEQDAGVAVEDGVAVISGRNWDSSWS